MFVIVFEYRTIMSNNMNVTIINLGPLEQKPGREQGSTVLLYESSYVG